MTHSSDTKSRALQAWGVPLLYLYLNVACQHRCELHEAGILSERGTRLFNGNRANTATLQDTTESHPWDGVSSLGCPEKQLIPV